MAGALNKFACRKCTPAMQEAWGCDTDAPHPFHVIDGEPITRCPVTILTNDTRRLMGLYVHYTKGFLPAAGGILNQTAYYYQAMEVLVVEVNRVQRAMQDKERDKFKQRTGGASGTPTRSRPVRRRGKFRRR